MNFSLQKLQNSTCTIQQVKNPGQKKESRQAILSFKSHYYSNCFSWENADKYAPLEYPSNRHNRPVIYRGSVFNAPFRRAGMYNGVIANVNPHMAAVADNIPGLHIADAVSYSLKG